MQKSQDYLGDIIIVDDTPANLSVLSAMLQKDGYRVRPAINGDAALKAADVAPPDLILLDIRMPGMNGFEVCQRLKSSERTKSIPVIFISALGNIEDKITAYEMGGVDYITKPFEAAEVRLRVRNHITIANQQKQIEHLDALKSELINTVTHNIQSPIGIVTACADLLRMGKTDDSQFLGDQLLQAAQWINELVDGFLNVSRIESGLIIKFQEIDALKWAEATIKSLQFYADRKQIDLRVRTSPTDLKFVTDPNYLAEALRNLISIAIKYLPEGGHVHVEIFKDANGIVCEVIDNGIDIPESELPHVFEKLFRLPQDDENTPYGFGRILSITRAIVEQLDGSLLVESNQGNGCVFRMVLPVVDLIDEDE